MIKSNYGRRSAISVDFPKLMISDATAGRNPYYIIVLFLNEDDGVVVAQTRPTARFSVGRYLGKVLDSLDIACFRDYDGIVELENKG